MGLLVGLKGYAVAVIAGLALAAAAVLAWNIHGMTRYRAGYTWASATACAARCFPGARAGGIGAAL